MHKLRLSWCECQPHKGEKLGGWAHENFLGMARILPWAHEEITTFDEVDEHHEPDSPVSRWTVNQCKNFLHPRRLPLGGRVSKLRKLVSEN